MRDSGVEIFFFPIVSPLAALTPVPAFQRKNKKSTGIQKKKNLSAEKRTPQREASIGGPMGYTTDVCGKASAFVQLQMVV